MSASIRPYSDRLRLKTIKLAGFKSFVDPTTVPFPSNLVGVVGPNGCGKSNIIDAVRWVMGESSAKSLRAENGTDVIFNGSTERKPVGQASVELLFDNPNGAIGGEYAKYSEISVKRVITRDGQSTYFLNNTRCRRKDISDLFLGTGLGPRSYAIIEQGMISKLIEAKPEDLRVYLEEAAGISKYKERRRETENRIRHTRDNLDRLNDLREELHKQLARLERQAQSAEKFKEYKKQERSVRAQLLALRWQMLSEQINTLNTTIQKLQVDLEAQVSRHRACDAEIVKIREHHYDAQEAFQQVQEQFYGIGGQISRAEQSISHQKERVGQLQADHEEARRSLEQASWHIEQDRIKIELSQEALTVLEPEFSSLTETLAASNEHLATAEAAMSSWQARSDNFNIEASKVSQEAQVQQTQIQHLEQQIAAAKQRIGKLQQDHERLLSELNVDEIIQIQAKVDEASQLDAQKQNEIQTLQDNIRHIRDDIKVNTDLLAQKQSASQTMQGRKASLEALQQAALGKNNGKITKWLDNHDLGQKPRLAENLQVEAGFEIAVETVLGNYLQAVCIDSLEQMTDIIETLTEGELCFIEKSSFENLQRSTLIPLSSKINEGSVASHFLNHIYMADNLSEAMKLSKQLADHESVITPEGIWIGKNWLKISKDKDQTSGVIERERELVKLAEDLAFVYEEITEHEEKGALLRERLQTEEQSLQQVQQSYRELSHQLAALKADLKIKESRQEQVNQRLAQVAEEREELEPVLTKTHEELLAARTIWQQAMTAMEQQSEVREALMNEKDELRHEVDHYRQKSKHEKEQYHSVSIKINTLKTELAGKQDNVNRMQAQLEQLTSRCEQLSEQLAMSHEPIAELQYELEALLEQRLVASDNLSEARNRLETLDRSLKEQEQLREDAQQQTETIRNQLQDLRMRWQEQEVRAKTIVEQLQADEENLDEIIANMPEEANEREWDENLTQITQRIARLGPINLAAIDEYTTESERKVFLDKQYDDLMEAITTLEAAIQKIDKETRQKFKETYDIVNGHFQVLFPKVFGGGSAYLELVGEDLLDTGISVMARPPGKKNSTIHLLSGGEKALTAIALVFSIFQLNPAPFCILDEVDAPLDDANVGRYCNLIKEMSQRVQFIFISHNKVAIEMAEQLAGVTMKEPGVSRMVSVDIDQAIAMAEA